jgi:ATP-dependent DNA helicase RecG
VLSEIVRDLGGTTPMARLLQGDVGSGKTAVAAMALLTAVEDGRQAALMAPTELLAEQLHRVVSAPLESAGFEVRLLTGSTAAGEARAILTGLEEGDVDVVVGTHALFQERIGFADLGLVVIDEQHRFGVAQRQRLVDKGDAPHLLVMTATPIPRSLALTLYGDLDLSLIDELPPGRSPVRTVVRPPEARSKIFRFLRSEIAQGGQVYIVYPMIEGSGSIEAAALENDVEEVKACLPGVKVGILHGRMDRAEREAAAGAFRRRELQVLLATTVIEVGVDVPSASVMLVESADRFGLSQLHQLRGRVGRGERRSWCILVAGAGLSDAAVRRLAVLERTTDGFEIAEADLLHRGPGELTGLRQWGAEGFRFADLARDRRLLSDARETAKRLGDAGELERVRDALLSFHPIGGRFAIG